jgi:hypothetical protein
MIDVVPLCTENRVAHLRNARKAGALTFRISPNRETVL